MFCDGSANLLHDKNLAAGGICICMGWSTKCDLRVRFKRESNNMMVVPQSCLEMIVFADCVNLRIKVTPSAIFLKGVLKLLAK